ncbi:Rv2578c family radical SAM protein [Salinibacterium sp. ZJ450]|uniref:Rv2578c family radical SAM protein n=1 Tax=Salinibacterium sp. ZJ450 TaxID=2708338 RepID=UPI00141F274E|nr:Rv2578c family radical SAM protein [Salinibacterium sp. ZJ450]
MRWSGQQVNTEQEQDGALPGLAKLNNLVRTVRTPEFDGITFYEVLAKSALNHVPGPSAMPFGWTINPYRGCTHSCVYCLSGDTFVLMGDGNQKPLQDVRVGDEIYGTEVRGSHRRYVKTTVLAHWKTSKPGYLITLADGTELVASGDHRFLSDRGWKHVTGAMSGPDTRPYLTTNNKLMGFGTTGLGGVTLSIDGAAVKSDARLQIVSIVPLRGGPIDMYDITTGTGDFIANGVISHNCFARSTHRYLDLDTGKDFDSQIIVKVNVAEVLAKELAKPSWEHHPVALGTNTDPYQRAEGRYRLMPGIIAALAESGTPFSILTKGTMLRRDIPLLAEASERVPVDVAMSIAIFDDRIQQSIEPGTPTPTARLATVTAVRDAGMDCSVFMMPILPFLTDTTAHLDEALRQIKAAGATSVLYTALHLRADVKDWYMLWLDREFPELGSKYRAMYRTAYAPKDYRSWLAARMKPLIHKHGLQRGREDPATGGVRSAALGLLRTADGERASLIAEELPPSMAARAMQGAQPTLF